MKLESADKTMDERQDHRLDKTEILSHYFGYRAFRPGQEKLIDRILAKQDVLGIMPTGAGKSICYQVPALMLPGTCLVISPLISLMKDQVMALKAAGVPAAFLNASLTEKQMFLAMERAAKGAYKIIYVAPERLRTPGFQYLVSRMNISMVAVDEAHCVSHWGHEFRPEYQRIAEFVDSLPERPHYCAFTATATEEVKKDIIELLGLRHPFIEVTGFDRPNLYFEVFHPKDRDDKLLSLCAEMRKKTGIVYCMSRKNVETVCRLLNQAGFSATRYHAGLEDEERRKNQEDFQFDRARIMVATNAFGMGIDKSNVRYVIHYNLPLSMEAYYQEAGRAGRDGLEARCILLYQKRDIGMGEYLLENSESKVEMSVAEKAQIQELEKRRFREVQRYAQTKECLRRFILRYFGESAGLRCGACSNCQNAQHAREKVSRPVDGKGWAGGSIPTAVHADRSAGLRTAGTQPGTIAGSKGNPAPEKGTLFGYLQQIRNMRASNAGLPPYIVCSDQTLKNMEELLPLTVLEIAEINGMGFAKARAYGETFVRGISSWLLKQKQSSTCSPENRKAILEMRQAGKNVKSIAVHFQMEPTAVGWEIVNAENPEGKKEAQGVVQPPVKVHPSIERPARQWNSKEINWLRMLYEKRWTVHSIARQMGRKDMEIVEQLYSLGLKPRYDLPDDLLPEDNEELRNRE